MELRLDPAVAEDYTSKSQRSRVITEHWAEANLYCLACDSPRLNAHRPGKAVEDFLCPRCDRRTQLKAARGGHGKTVSNSAYTNKVEAIRANRAPDYAFMGFDPERWRVTDLFVVPGHFLTEPVVEKRNPLRASARRSGWVGSNILLGQIPQAGRIHVVEGGELVPATEARATFQRTAFLERKRPETRGWVSAILDCLDELDLEPGDEFVLSDVYRFEGKLKMRYPDNQHIRAKIRQQLQVLRDEGWLEFLDRGHYRVRGRNS